MVSLCDVERLQSMHAFLWSLILSFKVIHGQTSSALIEALPDSSFTATSYFPDLGSWAPYKARYSQSGWATLTASTSSSTEYLDIDLLQPMKIYSIGTKGNEAQTNLEWCTTYQILFSLDTKPTTFANNDGLTFYNNGEVLNGNTDKGTEVINTFISPITAQYIRFRPRTARGWMVVRIELYGHEIVSLSPTAPLPTTSSFNPTATPSAYPSGPPTFHPTRFPSSPPSPSPSVITTASPTTTISTRTTRSSTSTAISTMRLPTAAPTDGHDGSVDTDTSSTEQNEDEQGDNKSREPQHMHLLYIVIVSAVVILVLCAVGCALYYVCRRRQREKVSCSSPVSSSMQTCTNTVTGGVELQMVKMASLSLDELPKQATMSSNIAFEEDEIPSMGVTAGDGEEGMNEHQTGEQDVDNIEVEMNEYEYYYEYYQDGNEQHHMETARGGEEANADENDAAPYIGRMASNEEFVNAAETDHVIWNPDDDLHGDTRY